MNPQTKNNLFLPILLVSFLSGISCLIYELVWSRYLNLIFGVSVYATATVLACFMLGLALGSWHLGKLADRSKNGRILIWLELGIGIYILLSPFLYRGIAGLAILIFQSLNPEGFLKHTIRFALAVLALVFPTYLMGGTFPAFLKIFTRQPERLGGDLALIYAVNTFGGAVGAFLTGFVLIQAFGLSNSMFFAAALSLTVAGTVAIMLRKSGQLPNTLPPEKRRPKKTVAVPAELVFPQKIIYLTVAIFGLSGFTSLAYEVYWTKILTYFFRDSIYDFAIVLTAFLVGIVHGSLICGKFINKSKNPALGFALVEILIGFFSMLGLFLISRFPYLLNYLQTNTALVQEFGEDYWTAGTLIRFGYAFLVMIVPTSLFGATFPLAGRICAANLPALGRTIGLLNGINTVGATLGSLAAGFFLISWLGLEKGIMLTAFLNIAAGLLLTAALPPGRKTVKYAVLTGTILVGMIVAVYVPGWDKLRMSTSFLEPNQPLEELLSLQYYREDAYGLTSVVELRPFKRKYLVTNRLYAQNSSDMMGLEDHRRLGHIPMLLHPQARSALLIGLGAGVSLSGLGEHDLPEIDCVELSGSVIEAARSFADENNRIFEDPRIKLMIDDGRNYISTTRRRYDLIVGDILFPMSSGSSNVFSREYFQLCRKRLAPGGIFCQWLPVHQLAMNEIKIITRTFRTVFPHTSLWYGMIGESIPVVGCLGTEKELAIDLRELAKKYQNPALVEKLREVNLDHPSLLLSHFIMAGRSVQDFCQNQPINTDDHPIIEFLAPKRALRSYEQGVVNLVDFSQMTQEITPYLISTAATGSDLSLLQSKLEKYRAGKKTIIAGFKLALNGNQDGQFNKYQEALVNDPSNEDLLYSIKLLLNL